GGRAVLGGRHDLAPTPCRNAPMPETAAAPDISHARSTWTGARRIVVKIGSALLTDRKTGTLKAQWLESLVEDVADLVGQGKDVVLVSSGSIALGRHKLGLPIGRALELEESQAAASVGQIGLAHAYQELAGKFGLTAAQIL